eukprot:15485250-Alexandrium_andersonii.AAC.1
MGGRPVGVLARQVHVEGPGDADRLDTSAHGLDHHGDALVGLVVDDAAAQPEAEARLADGLWLEVELGLDDGADDGVGGERCRVVEVAGLAAVLHEAVRLREEGAALQHEPELRQDVLAASDRLAGVVSRGIG